MGKLIIFLAPAVWALMGLLYYLGWTVGKRIGRDNHQHDENK